MLISCPMAVGNHTFHSEKCVSLDVDHKAVNCFTKYSVLSELMKDSQYSQISTRTGLWH